MAKVRCAKCGEIFGLQQGEIQVCPVCNCRMKVNRKPQTDYRSNMNSVSNNSAVPTGSNRTQGGDEYDALRREYMDMMRDKLGKNKNGDDGVYLTREEYDALVKKASAAPAVAAPQYTAPAYSAPAAPQYTAPAYSTPAAPAPDDYSNYRADENADDETEVKKKFGFKKAMNWFSFLFALLAGVMSALLLVFDAMEGIKGMDMFLPLGQFDMPLSLVSGAIFFFPALCAVFALISSAIKGKTSKFILMLLFLIAAVSMLLMPFLYLSAGTGSFEVKLIVDTFKLHTVFSILAIVLDGLAFLAMFIAGIVTPKKRRNKELE